MGSTLRVPQNHSIAFRVHVEGCQDTAVHLFVDGSETATLPPLQSRTGSEVLPFQWTSDGNPHWLRAEVRDTKGALQLLSNPIYINQANR